MGDVYQAERILDSKIIKGKRYFLIKWHGWDETNNTWEPTKNIIDTRLIDVFFKKKRTLSVENSNLVKIQESQVNSTKETMSCKNVKNKNNLDLKNSNCYEFSDEGSSSGHLSEHNKSEINYKKESSKINPSKISKNVQQDELRSAIREAEGLRPIVKQRICSTNQQTKINQKKEVETLETSDEELFDKNKYMSRNKNINFKAVKNKRLENLKRRKISSSLSFSSNSSSLIPLKKRLTIKKKIKYSDDEYEEYLSNEENDESDFTIEATNIKKANIKIKKSERLLDKNSFLKTVDKLSKNSNSFKENFNEIGLKINDNLLNNSNKYKLSGYRTKDTNDENENSYDEGDSSFEDCNTMITILTNSDDIFVTDVTSGVVTVTIKESVSKEGFFKKRNNEKEINVN